MRIFTTREVIPAEDGRLLFSLKLRKQDQDELETVHGMNPMVALVTGINGCRGKVWLSSCDGVPFLVSGVEPLKHEGIIWAVGTDLIAQGGRDIIRWGKKHVEVIGSNYEKLWNYMDCRNVIHRRYVESLGFTFTGRKVSFNRYPFEYFEKLTGGK